MNEQKWTEEQRKIIKDKNNLIVSASAGTGKTFVITQKIEYEIQLNKSFQKIAALTFTNKAADALNLLTPGQRAWLEQSDINPTEYLRQVKEQGQASSVQGEAVVRVNFDANGNVIVGVNTPRIVEDSVPPDVRDEAIRIIKNSGSIVNKRGQVVSLAIPVVLGQ